MPLNLFLVFKHISLPVCENKHNPCIQLRQCFWYKIFSGLSIDLKIKGSIFVIKVDILNNLKIIILPGKDNEKLVMINIPCI